MKIFVYGTLKNGNRKKDYVKGKLHSLGSFPGINLDGDNLVEVEIVDNVNETLLAYWDMYEGYVPGRKGNLYERVEITTVNGEVGYIYEFSDKEKLNQFPIVQPDTDGVSVWNGNNNIMAYMEDLF